MTLFALALVLISALAHATWNFLLRTSDDKLAFSWCFAAVAAVLYLPLTAVFVWLTPIPPVGWLYLLGTMLLHVAYFHLLGQAYTHADLSLAYPVARGTGVALIPIVGSLVLGEHVGMPAAAAIAAIVTGALLAHARGLTRGALLRVGATLGDKGTRFALATGLIITSYSVLDKRAVAVVAPAVVNYAIFIGQALAMSPVALRRREALRREISLHRRAIVAAAVLSPLAYLLVLAALTFSPVSYVAPAREIGIVVGAVLGTVVLREPYGANRLLGSILIAAGVLGLALVP